MEKRLILLVFTTIFLISCGNKELTLDEQYSNSWREPNREELITIGRTLIKNNCTICAEYFIKPSSQNTGEYLVGCSSDGTTWSYYIVWCGIEKIIKLDSVSKIKKPR